MTDLKPGDLVICVDDDWRRLRVLRVYPRKNGIYTVRGIVSYTEGDGLMLEEILNPLSDNGNEMAWDSGCFRPIRKPDIEVLRRIVERAPDEVGA